MGETVAWQARVAAGRCGQCGALRHPQSRSRCGRCLARARTLAQDKHGWSDWRPGSHGRPPTPGTLYYDR